MKKMWKIKTTLILLLVWSFASPAISGTDGKNMVQDQTGTYYIVQKGDTLWDISNLFLHSPWYWPEIWSVNSDIPILNPHLIFPGQRLRLYGRRDVPESPASAAAAVPVPPMIAALRYFHYPPINRVGFIQKLPEPSFGTIFKDRGDKQMISMDDIVYIQETAGHPLAAGDRYTVFRTSAPLYDREEHAPIGIQHLITGTVEILQKTDTYVMGKIIQSYRDISTGDQLMALYEPSARIPLTGSVAGLSARIITSEEHTSIMGEHDIAFIDKGAEDGVQPGQEYEIFEVDRVKPPKMAGEASSEEIIVPVPVGKALVLLTRPTAATCLITSSLKSLKAGLTVAFP